MWALWTCAVYIHIPTCVSHSSCPSSESHIASPELRQSCSKSMHPAEPALCTTPSYLTLQPSKMASTLHHHIIVLAVLIIVYTDTQCIHKQSPKTTQKQTKPHKSTQNHTKVHKTTQNETAGIICPWALHYNEDSCEMQSGVSGRVDVRQCLPYCLRPSQQPGMLCRPQHVGPPSAPMTRLATAANHESAVMKHT